MGNKTKNTDILSAGTHLAKKEKRSGKLKKVITALLVIVVIAAVIGLNVYNYVSDSGSFARRTVAVSSDNYSLTSAQMSYHFYTQYQSFYTMYASYGLDMSSYLNTGTSLKLQDCIFSNDQTWFDYFMSMAVETATQQLALCEAAKAEGIELDDADYTELDSIMENIKSTAKEQGMSLGQFIKNNYGTYVKASDIEEAVKLQLLASKYTEKCMNDVDVSDDTLQAVYDESPNSYDTVDYLSYTFDFNDIIDADEEAAKAESDETAETTDEDETESEEEEVDPAVKAAAAAEAKDYADRLAAVTTEEEFKNIVREYLINALHMTETKADETIEAEGYVVEDATYTSTDDQSVWAFGNAKVGDVKLFEEVEDHEHEEDDDHSALANTYTVLMLTRERGRDESISYRDVRHILFTNETYEDDSKAREVYDKWVADGATLEDFEALVKEYSEDTGSVATGGLYEGVTEGQMVEEFENWLFDEEREVGDYGFVESESYGWHIMRYEGGIEGWKGQIKTELQSEAQSAAIETAVEDYAVNVDNDVLDEIPA